MGDNSIRRRRFLLFLAGCGTGLALEPLTHSFRKRVFSRLLPPADPPQPTIRLSEVGRRFYYIIEREKKETPADRIRQFYIERGETDHERIRQLAAYDLAKELAHDAASRGIIGEREARGIAESWIMDGLTISRMLDMQYDIRYDIRHDILHGYQAQATGGTTA